MPQYLHSSTYDYLKPTDVQIGAMDRIRVAARLFSDVLEAELPDNSDKVEVLRGLRTSVMWANVALMRFPNGRPRVP